MQREEVVVDRPAYLNKDNKRSKRLEWRKKEKDRYNDNDNNYNRE